MRGAEAVVFLCFIAVAAGSLVVQTCELVSAADPQETFHTACDEMERDVVQRMEHEVSMGTEGSLNKTRAAVNSLAASYFNGCLRPCARLHVRANKLRAKSKLLDRSQIVQLLRDGREVKGIRAMADSCACPSLPVVEDVATMFECIMTPGRAIADRASCLRKTETRSSFLAQYCLLLDVLDEPERTSHQQGGNATAPSLANDAAEAALQTVEEASSPTEDADADTPVEPEPRGSSTDAATPDESSDEHGPVPQTEEGPEATAPATAENSTATRTRKSQQAAAELKFRSLRTGHQDVIQAAAQQNPEGFDQDQY